MLSALLAAALGATPLTASALADLHPAPPMAQQGNLPDTSEAGAKGPALRVPSSGAAAGTGESAESWVRVGVIVASRRGLPEDRPLRYAYQDGEKLERLLATVGQVEPENLFYLKSEQREPLRKSAAKVGERIAALKRAGRKVFLQFYYTGHGAAKQFHFSDGPLPFDDLKESLGGARADARVYVLDVCFGASFFTAKGFRTAPPVQLQMEMDKTARGEVTISSSGGDEQAYEVRTLGGSIFTSHWIMALRGAGDRNRDGQVTLFEAYNYAYDRTSGYSAETLARPQHPSFQIDLTGARDVMLARLLRSSTGILFRNCPAGNYHVLDLGRGHPIGEVRLPDGEEFSLALERGRYQVRYQPVKGKTLSADVDLPASGMSPLPFAAFGPAAEGAAQGKGLLMRDPDTWDPEGPSVVFAGEGTWRWALSFGASRYQDQELHRGFASRSEVDHLFSFSDRALTATAKTSWNLDITWSPGGLWVFGGRLGLATVDWSHAGTGYEPLEGLSEEQRRAHPVQLEWDYRFDDASLVLYAGRRIPLGRVQSLSVDLGGGFVSRDGDGERRVYRSLYQTTSRSRLESNSDGWRAEGGVGWNLMNAGEDSRSVVGLGLRLGAYTQALTDKHPMAGAAPLHSDETGVSLSLAVSVGLRRPLPAGGRR